MACSVNRQTVRNGIVNDINDTLLISGQYLQQGVNIVRTVKNKITRLPQSAERGRTGLIESATNELKGFEGIDQEDPSTILKQVDVLTEWAKTNDKWLTEDSLGEQIGAGSESKVYRKDDRVFKATNNALLPSPLSQLDRFTISNSVVENAVPSVLEGFSEIDGEFVTITSQPFIEGSPLSDREVVRTTMARNGWVNEAGDDYSKDEYLLSDIRPESVILDDQGQLNLIDVVATLNTPDEGYDGKQSYKPLSNNSILDSINETYGSEVVSEKGDIVSISVDESVVDDFIDTLDGDTISDTIIAETMQITVPGVSPQQQMKVSNLLTKLGIDIDNLKLNSQDSSVEALAIPMQALVAHVDGQEDKLPEEVFHVALEILSVNHRGLLNKMLSEITKLPIYQEVFEKYKNNSQYQKDGKPDLIKIKKEAIAQQLASQFVQPEIVLSWWSRVKEYLNGLFTGTGIDLAPFRNALNVVSRGDIGTVRSTMLQSMSYLKSQGISEENASQVILLAQSNIPNDELRLHIDQITPTDVFYSVSVGAKNSYDKLSEIKTLPDFVSIVGDRLATLFGSNTSKEFMTALDFFKKPLIKSDVTNILTRYVDDKGNVRQQPLPYTTSTLDRQEYDELERLVVSKLASFVDSKVLVDKLGADMVVVDSNGVANIFNFTAYDNEIVPPNFREALDTLQTEIQKVIQNNSSVNVGQNRTVVVPVVNDKIVKTENVIHRNDRTGNAQLDVLIGNLYRTRDRLTKTASDARLFSNLSKAINDLKTSMEVNGLIQTMYNVRKRAEDLVKQYEEFQKDDHTQEEITQFANQLDASIQYVASLSTVYSSVKSVVDSDPSKYDTLKLQMLKLKDAQERLDGAESILKDVNDSFTSIYSATPNGESNFLSIERAVRSLSKNFNKFSDSVTKATRVLYTIVSRAQNGSRIAVSSQMTELLRIQNAYNKVADKKNYLSLIAQKSKTGKYIHKLISKYDMEKFRSGLSKAVTKNDVAWLKENINVSAYKDWYEKVKVETFTAFENTRMSKDDTENATIIQERKDRWENTYNIDENVSPFNNKLVEFVNDNNLSEEYKNLKANKPAYDLWKYMYDLNQRAYENGSISKTDAQTLLPSVQKNLVEQLTTNGKIKFNQGFLGALLTPEDYAAETNINPETGMPEEKLPFFFTRDIGTEKEGERDYSNVSQDLFKILPHYLYQLEFAERIRPQEAQIRLMGIVEKNKQVVATNDFGEVVKGGGSVKSDQNFEYYNNFVRMAVYGHRDLDGSYDQKIITFTQDKIKWVNKTLGTKFDESTTASAVTARNLVKVANKLFQMKVLGLNVFIPIANLVGSEFQAYINAGSEFTTSDLNRNQFKSLRQGWSDVERSTFTGLADYFQVFVDGMNIERMQRQLTQKKLASRDIPEFLMALQSESEVPLQMMIAGAMFDTHMVRNGEIVSIRKFVKDKYANYYDLTSVERNEADKKIEAEIKTLMDKESLSKVAKTKDGVLVIPGVERQSQTVYDFINRTQAHVKRATGGGNKEDIRQINGTIIGSSLMVFKSWMPRMIQNRVSGLRYYKSVDAWEMGRYNAVGKHLSVNVVKSAVNLFNIVQMNDKGVDRMKETYEQHKLEYENRTGEPLTMTQKEYIDMSQRLIKNALKDVMIASTMLGLWALMGAMEPPEDKTDPTWLYNTVYNLTERFKKEMTFYYDPREIFNVFDGSLFPALGVVKDFKNAISEIGKTITYELTGDEKLEKDTHLFKAITRPIPILNQSGVFLQIFDEEYAKELGFKDLTPTKK